MKVFIGFLLILILILISLNTCKNKDNHVKIKINQDSIYKEQHKITIINNRKETKGWVDDNLQFWTPSENQLYLVDSIIEGAFGKHLNINTFKSYYRQYVCYVDASGDLIVFVNAMCQVPDGPVFETKEKATWKRFDWQHQLLMVNDGGDCFWNIHIDVSKKKYFNFRVNGVAYAKFLTNT